MARSSEWEKLAMAQGDPKPAWPLPTVTPKFATWSLGGGRPYGCATDKCERWHAGVDLTGAPDGALILAPEDALVVGIDRGWSEGSKAAFLRTSSGLFLVLGGFKAGSHKEYGITTGQQVRKGDKLGRVLGSYGMIHLETYAAETRSANSVWWRTEPPPDGLLNPTNYVERMVGDKVSLLQTRQRHEALKTLGYYKGDVGATWGATSTEALRAAQAALGIGVDGKWGPETEDAIQRALAKLQGCSADECSPSSGSAVTGGASSDPLSAIGRLGWWIIGGATFVGVAVGLAVAMRAREQ
ncbi:peptidoglycan-binding protein [Nannocystis pusilla]|uniref:Peptidoglycan-binding protein n=1 Tax=Nannocystis pusilla TaxID=889268 RepID=A0ABS7TMC1_9BACT|nr:peptidoglycan-binding protein [Nannocystis pusilla]MBZ5709372.1 peptidoglycan-binding protein [Nannocystis pusilla]